MGSAFMDAMDIFAPTGIRLIPVFHEQGAARLAFPGVPQLACIDTAFDARQDEINRHFALPAALHEPGVRRYGFHGLTYDSIARQLARASSSRTSATARRRARCGAGGRWRRR